MTRSVSLVAAVLLASLLGSCVSETETSSTVSFGERVDIGAMFSSMADAYDSQNPYATAGFYSAGGTLDARTWGAGIATTAEEAVYVVRRFWFMEGPLAEGTEVTEEHLFVDPASAVVLWYAYREGGYAIWAQEYIFGDNGRIASRIYSEGDGWAPAVQEQVSQKYDAYLDLWQSRNPALIPALYADGARIYDGILGATWLGEIEIANAVRAGPTIEAGPYPTTYKHLAGGHLELIALLFTDSDCPRLEARRLIFDGDLIVEEIRFTHVPSAERCGIDLGSGWWEEFTAPPPLEGLETAAISAGESSIALVNAEHSQVDFSEWLFDRYADAGFEPPGVAAIWYPPSNDCTGSRKGLAIESDDRYEGRHTATVCFTHEEIRSPDSESGWSVNALNYALHELAHIWMVDHLTDDLRDAFIQRADLPSWRSADDQWHERGVEHAATTIAWGLAGAEDARYMIPTDLSCEELASRFRMLTNLEPLTVCGDGET